MKVQVRTIKITKIMENMKDANGIGKIPKY